MTAAVYVTHLGTNWHIRPDCTALDDARLNEGGHILQERAEKTTNRRPCLVCATPNTTEWTVTDDNLGELLNLIDPSKPYWQDLGDGLQRTGLTIWPHKGVPRQVAYFGDTIRLDHASRYTVHPATQEQ